MNKLVKYNLEAMTGIFVVLIACGIFYWPELSAIQQMILVFMALYTLHEWEESRLPGGFYRIFFSKCTIDPNVGEERMHLPVAIYLLSILLAPFIFDHIVILAMVPLLLALFEGVIHTAGIVIHQLKRPYSPGMLSAWMLFAYAFIMIGKLNDRMHLNAMDWILGILLTVISFFTMENFFMKGVGITIKEFQTAMRNHMLGRIKKSK